MMGISSGLGLLLLGRFGDEYAENLLRSSIVNAPRIGLSSRLAGELLAPLDGVVSPTVVLHYRLFLFRLQKPVF
ncbi:hypothetical protein L6164_010603 [Bauhinia variegata]|uniref:Uncharacterized protein n=1 Tax=Bauhinia variegata TaxID=167791 RepID=A0ACB9PMS8_BAUVA|nr:hypothetical protein L6164_010603 [Bauhinia variegata]